MSDEGRREDRTQLGRAEGGAPGGPPARETDSPPRHDSANAPDPPRRVVDAGTSDELVILDYSVEMMEQAGRWQPPRSEEPEAPEPRGTPPEPEPPSVPEESPAETPSAPDTDAADRGAGERRGGDRRSGDRRARIGHLLDRDWDRELAPDEEQPARPGRPARAGQRGASRPSESLPRGSDALAIGATLVFVAASVLMALRVEPFATWYYVFAWYPFLALVNHTAAVRAPRVSILGRLDRWMAVAAWSVPVWMTFELWNLRLQNWYYVGVPASLALRWPGVVLSFATVLPGIFLLEEALRVHGLASRRAAWKLPVTPRVTLGMRLAGLIWAALILALPKFFFPLVWGVPVLLLEPWLAGRDDASLLRRLSTGRPGLVARLLVAGAACGLFWETANYFALGKWIYTVPGLEKLRLFEMPLLGFVGFPPFALCCWSMARALVALGLLPDWRVRDADEEDTDALPRSPATRRIAIGAAATFTLLMLPAMDRWTVDSTTPRPADVPGIPDGVAEYASRQNHDSVRGLLELIEQGKLYVPGESSEQQIALLGGRCRLVLLRGIGTANARRLDRAGIRTVDELAAADPDSLTRRLATVERGWTPHPRRVAIWVAAARSEHP